MSLGLPTSASCLPADVLHRILSFLPRPVFSRRLRSPSPLLRTALVSRTFGRLSQRVLFGCVFLAGRSQMEVWAGTDAREWTSEMEVVVGREELEGEEGAGWVGGWFERGLKGKDGQSGVRLKVLKIGGVEEGNLGVGWGELDGLSGLTSLSLTCPLPGPFTPAFLPALRHLKLATPTPFAPAPFPVLPHLTHLTLSCPPPHCPDFSTSFPRLNNLIINDLSTNCAPSPHLVQLCFALSRAPPSRAHFGTASSPQPLVLASLPRSVIEVCLNVDKTTDLRPLVDQRTRAVSGEGGLRIVHLVGVTTGFKLRMLNQRAAGCASELWEAGCDVKLREGDLLVWRG